ncbi:MAG: hypothetical protein HY290_30965 [Planctomycetia bacterium]|nr:hypothetical protein [Planctomycetia bacterium]
MRAQADHDVAVAENNEDIGREALADEIAEGSRREAEPGDCGHDDTNATRPRWRRNGTPRPPQDTPSPLRLTKVSDRVDPFFFGRDLRRIFKERSTKIDWHSQAVVADRQREPLILEWGCDVRECPAEWLWPNRIPLERLTLLAGDDTRSASLVAHDLAARLSRGGDWPDAAGPRDSLTDSGPRDSATGASSAADEQSSTAIVIYCSPQPERATFCVPGLVRAGADMTRILCLDGVFRLLGKGRDRICRALRLPLDIGNLRGAVRALAGVQLVVLDPIEAFFDVRGGNGAVRRSADLLAELAYDYGVAVVAVTRLKPAAPGRRFVPAVENKMLTAAADTAWGVVSSERRDNKTVLLPIKFPVEGLGPALGLTVDPNHGSIAWDPEPVDLRTDDFATESNSGFRFAVAATWLKGVLSSGPRLKEEIDRLASEAGITQYMLRSVRTELHVTVDKQGFQGKSRWMLSEAPQEGAQESARNIDAGRASLEETAEISKLARCDESPQV